MMELLATTSTWLGANLATAIGVTVFLAVVSLTMALSSFVSRETMLRRRAFQPFMMTSVHSVQRGPPPPGPTAIFSIRRSPSRCVGLKLRV